MDNTRQLWRRNWGYVVLIGLAALYACLPHQCGVTGAVESAHDLIIWIKTWPEGIQ